jgi:hypothetical protein
MKYKVGDIVATRAYCPEKAVYAEVGGAKIENETEYYLLYPITSTGGHSIGVGRWFSEEDTHTLWNKIVNVPDTVWGRDMKLKAEAMETARINVSEPNLSSEKSYYEKLRDEFVIKTMSEFRLRYPHELGGDEMLEQVINTANAIVERLTQEQ